MQGTGTNNFSSILFDGIKNRCTFVTKLYKNRIGHETYISEREREREK
jgi:hypothetical protein